MADMLELMFDARHRVIHPFLTEAIRRAYANPGSAYIRDLLEAIPLANPYQP